MRNVATNETQLSLYYGVVITYNTLGTIAPFSLYFQEVRHEAALNIDFLQFDLWLGLFFVQPVSLSAICAKKLPLHIDKKSSHTFVLFPKRI